MEQTLPPVARSIHTPCKKCGVDRYHRVLAHTSSTSAKVECEVCHSKKTFSLASKSSASGVKRTPAGAAKSKVPKSLLKHQDEYHEMLQNLSGQPEVPFSVKTKFQEKQKLRHSKFGLGFVKAVFPEKVEVLFPDEIKTLVHNRG